MANTVGRLELRNNRAYWRGIQVDLTVMEYAIVERLVSHLGIDVTYQQLYAVVHPAGFISGYEGAGCGHSIRSFIKRIRKKFKTLDVEFRAIVNYREYGYSWEAE